MNSGLRKVNRTDIGDWVSLGEFHEDTQYHNTTYSIIAHCEDGIYVHEIAFLNDPEGAERLRQRVEDYGYIDLAHWGFHEFWSLTLEERFAEEAWHENLHRNNMGHRSNGIFSEGHV